MAPHEFALRCLLAVCATLGCASCASQRTASLRLDWHPRLDQPIQQLEEVLAATEQQQPRNYTSANLAFLLDAKLYLLFEGYINSLPQEARPALLEEQRRWLEQRKLATDEAYDEYQGGTLASFAGNRAFIEATKERITALERRLGPAIAATVP